MFRLVHATPVHPSLCLPHLNPTVTVTIATVSLLLLLLLLLCCCYYKLLLLINFCEQELFPGAAELTTQLLRLASIMCVSPYVESINWVILPSKTVAIPYTCGSSVPPANVDGHGPPMDQ